MTVLFEQPYQGNLWRLEVVTHDGRTFGNWRKWYWQGTELRPTRHGTTIPLERMGDLHAALETYLASAPPAATLTPK